MKTNRFFRAALFSIVLVSFIIVPYCLAYGLPGGRTIRLSGNDRFKTAVRISRQGWNSSDYVILATGDGEDKFADALAGVTLSKAYNAPILLTNTDELNMDTLNEIIVLGAKKAFILGGSGVVSDKAKQQLESTGVEVIRLWGQDRYETAVEIAKELKRNRTFNKAILTTGWEFQYAMMIAPFAAINYIPIFFTGSDGLLPAVTREALVNFRIKNVEIIGNKEVVQDAVETELKGMGIEVERTGGSSVYETNINVAKKYDENAKSMALARDGLYFDALAGAPFAAKYGIPIFFVGQDLVSMETYNYVTSLNTSSNYVFGGPGAISDSVLNMLIPDTANPVANAAFPIIPSNEVLTGNTLPGNIPGNINNMGTAAVDGEWIYFRNINDNNSLYRSKPDGSDIKKLIDDQPYFINISGEWIYYINQKDDFNIYKIKKDGTCNEKIINDEAYYLIVGGEWIYYNNTRDSALYRIKQDGTGRRKISDDIANYINISENWIYYCSSNEGDRICKIRPDGTEKQILTSYGAANMIVAGEWIYYQDLTDDCKIYKIKITVPDIDTEITGDRTYTINTDGDWIYYTNKDDEFKIYKVKVDGSCKMKLNDYSSTCINVIGDWIYYINVMDGNRLYKIKTDGMGEQMVEHHVFQ